MFVSFWWCFFILFKNGKSLFLLTWLFPSCFLFCRLLGCLLALIVTIGSQWINYQWLFLVPEKGGRWHIIPQLAVYTTYILPSGGLYATYHPLQEPEKSIEIINKSLLNDEQISNKVRGGSHQPDPKHWDVPLDVSKWLVNGL